MNLNSRKSIFKVNYKNNPATKILIFCFINFALTSLARSIISPLIPVISNDLKVGLDLIGLAVSLNVFVLFLTTLITVNIIELIGFKKVIFLGLLFNIIGFFGLYLSYSYITFIISFFLLGIGIGILNMGIFSLIGSKYYEKKAENFIKLVIGWNIGSLIAPILASIIFFKNMSWRVLFIYLVIPPIILIFYLLFLKIPKEVKNTNNLKSLFYRIKKTTFNLYFILCCLMLFFHGAVTYTFFTWLTSYFYALNISIKMGSLFLASFSVSILIGAILKDFIIKKLREKKTLLYSTLISFIFLLMVLFFDNIILKNIFIFFFGINIGGLFAVALSLGIEGGRGNINYASGFLNASSYIGIIIFQYIIGYLLEYFSANSVLYVNLVLLFAYFVIALRLNMTGRILK